MHPVQPETVPSTNRAVGACSPPDAKVQATSSNEAAPLGRPALVVAVASEHEQAADEHHRHPAQRTGHPGPSGMPSRYQAMKNSVDATVTISAYGSISAITVPMPASFW